MAKSKSFEFKIVVVFILIAAGYLGYQKYFQPTTSNNIKQFIYDTNPKNNSFIIGALSDAQLKKLDKLLNMEKSLAVETLAVKEIEKTVGNEEDVVNAYFRWQKCKNMLRSKDHVIYPNERKYFKPVK